jgi:hypothetical protein
MASGNWNLDVIKQKPRCRLCGRAVDKGRAFTDGDSITVAA